MKEFFKKHWDLLFLAAILIAAIFLRIFHFSGWLHFGMDQARDAGLVSEAVKGGPSQLPLLGPRAGGTFVRLGPIFYYFEYISAQIFHSLEPHVFAYPDLLFSILTIPLFYFFLRNFFQKTTSLLVTALFAFNFVMLQFSRFAWNPNSVPFWTLLTFFALLKATRTPAPSPRSNSRNVFSGRGGRKYFWIVLASVGWAIAGQLHFIVLAAVPAVLFFYFLWTGNWRMFSWKEAILALLVVAIIFSPVILSDIKMKGDNVKQFIWAFQYKPQEHSLFANIKASVSLRANYYINILTTYTSPTGKASLAAGVALYIFGIGTLLYKIRKETDEKRKNFLKLIFVWTAVSFLVLVPLAFQIKPRFLFFEIFIPFMFVGFALEWLVRDVKFRKFTSFAAIALTLAIIGLNLEATKAWFQKLDTGGEFNIWGNRLAFVQYPKDITLLDFEKAADYVEAKWKEDPAKLYFYGNLEIRNPPLYLLELRNPNIDYSYFSFKTHDYAGRYFSITTGEGDFNSLPKYYQPKFDLTSDVKIGKLGIQELRLKEIQPTKSEVESLKDSDEQEQDSETETNAKKGIKKSDRVLWGDLF